MYIQCVQKYKIRLDIPCFCRKEGKTKNILYVSMLIRIHAEYKNTILY